MRNAIARNNWRDFNGLFDRSLLEDFFGGELLNTDYGSKHGLQSEFYETDTDYRLSVDLPGVKPEHVDVEFNDGVLKVSGERKSTREHDDKTHVYTEKSYGKFTRAYKIPNVVDTRAIEANFQDGVLHVTLPKSESAQPRRIEVKSTQ